MAKLSTEVSLDLESDGQFESDGTIYAKDGKQTTGVKSIWQHKASSEEVLERFRTNAASGLTLLDAEKRLAKFGRNILTPPLQKSWWKKILVHFTDFFSLMLQFAALMCFIAYWVEPSEPMHLYLGIFLYSVVIVTSIFSYVQQYKSDRTLKEFRHFLPPKATVRRHGGQTFVIDASELVVGDIVEMRLGDKIPADIRILSSSRFTVDNSSLTGESEPIELDSDMTSADPLEASNLAFFGCLAVDGCCTGVVIATGDQTVFGDIARLTSAAAGEAGQTTLQGDIHHFVINISIFAIAVGILFFVVGVFKGTKTIHNIVYSIGIIVSNIPEGLLATVTVSLTASARRMAQKNVLVKQLDAVETLGSTTVICSDKTGTLTQNKMNVSHMAYGGRVEDVHNNWIPPRVFQDFEDDTDRGARECLEALIYGASVCSTAVFDTADVKANPEKAIVDRAVSGDASEAGILRFTETIHNVMDFRRGHGVVATIPFNSKNKYMVTVHKAPDSDHVLRMVMKGAPENILSRCTKILSKDGIRDLTERDRALVEKQMTYMAGWGERVLGYAEKHLSPQAAARVLNGEGGKANIDEIPISDLCFVGLLSLIDPPRDAVPHAVQTCKNAGIKVIMVTGDHHATAQTVAKQVGIITKEVAGEDELSLSAGKSAAIVVKGNELHDISPAKWADILAHEEIVFARTSPQHKLQIVENLQRLGEVVTVTGDGCNDAPALKQSNTGVAMGISGSEVSREAANIVILDDNFASIVNGVEEGRLIFDNLKKSIAYTLTSNVPQLIPFLAFITLQIPLPLTTVLILSIDLGTDIFPAIALAYEKPESDIMKRPPRNAKNDHLMNSRLVSYSTLQLGIIQTFAGFCAYLLVMGDYGLAPGTLPWLGAGAHFATHRINDQRWLYTLQDRPLAVGREATWFKRENPMFRKYFKRARSGFLQQTKDVFSLIPATSKSSPKHTPPSKSENRQFENMMKIIGYEAKRPPCLAFQCNLNSGGATQNDFACFDPLRNKGLVTITGASNGRKNPNVREGAGPGQGCFELWTPNREKEALRRAQTAFFAAVVVAQVFTLFACKTRILSLLKRGISNSAVILALVLELALSLILIYSPLLRYGFNVRPLRLTHWLPGFPFGVFILTYDECRKWFIRRHLRNESGDVLPGEGRIDKCAKWVHDFTLW